MTKEAQKRILRNLHKNSSIQIDGRKLRPLKDTGYLNDDLSLTINGYHAIGLWKRAPYFDISNINPEDYSGKVIFMSEEFYRYDENIEEHSYELDAEKVISIYKEYLEVTNKYIKEYWSNEMDYALDRNIPVNHDEPLRQVDINIRKYYQGLSNRIINLAQRKAEEECSSKSDMRYTHHIIVETAKRYLDGQQNICVNTSKKYSFNDTEDELDMVKHKEAENNMYY